MCVERMCILRPTHIAFHTHHLPYRSPSTHIPLYTHHILPTYIYSAHITLYRIDPTYVCLLTHIHVSFDTYTSLLTYIFVSPSTHTSFHTHPIQHTRPSPRLLRHHRYIYFSKVRSLTRLPCKTALMWSFEKFCCSRGRRAAYLALKKIHISNVLSLTKLPCKTAVRLTFENFV